MVSILLKCKKVLLSIIVIAILALVIVGISKFYDRKYEYINGETKFSVNYFYSNPAKKGDEATINITEEGNYNFLLVDKKNNKLNEKSGKFTNTEMEEIFNYLMNDLKIYKVKSEVNDYIDADYFSLEVNKDGNKYNIKGTGYGYKDYLLKCCASKFPIVFD